MSKTERDSLLAQSIPLDPDDPCADRYAMRRGALGRPELFVAKGVSDEHGTPRFHGYPWRHEEYRPNPRPVPTAILQTLRDREEITPAEYKNALKGQLF